jgi:Zn-dependent protease with chaperone function
MTQAYLLKLLFLCLASFFFVHLALALAIAAVTPAALRFAERMRPALAARWLLTLRLIPAGLGMVLVAGLCVPSYLRFEPRAASSEQVSLLCVAGSLLAMLAWAISIARGLQALIQSHRYVRRWRRGGRPADLPEKIVPAWVIDAPASLFVLAGITRPRLFLSAGVLRVLSDEQLAAAVRHERAHWISRDNLKCLVLLLAPDILPFASGFKRLERAWRNFMERAADDLAVAGDAGRSLALASALVGVARLEIASRTPALVAPLLAGHDGLSARVERLLNSVPTPERVRTAWWQVAAALALCGCTTPLVLRPGMLVVVHRLLERLIQ